jgi:hypothetical protein
MLFALGCSGTAVSPLGNAVETDTDELGYAAEFTSDGSIYVSSPPSPRAASAPGDYIFDDSIIEHIDPLLFYFSHIPLVSGENEIDLTQFMYHGDGAYIDHSDIYLNYVVLDSEPGTTSYVTYGFRDIPEGENITRVELLGDGIFGDGAGNGLYIGIGDPEADTYEWVGPFKNGEDWAVNMWFMDNTSELQRSYITLMVANGDDASIYTMKVYVNGMPEIGYEAESIIERVMLDDPIPGPMEDFPFPIPDPHPGL